MKLIIFKELKKLPNLMIALAISLVFFNINYTLMSQLPGELNSMCVMGAALNAENLIFAGIMSALLGVFTSGFYTLNQKNQEKKKLGWTAASGTAGFIAGPFTVFCTLCTLPAISLFGISSVLNWFNDYNIAIKIISLIIVLAGLFLLNRQLKDECNRCIK